MITYTNQGNYLLIEVNEAYSFMLAKKLVHQIVAYGKKENLNKILLDLRNMDGDFKIMDRYEIGVEVAKVWGKDVQVASLAKESEINFLVENVAVNRGAKLRVFSILEPALEWLNVTDKE